MSFVYGKDIIPYIHYMYPLALAMTVYAITACGNSVLITLRKNKAVTAYSAVSLAVSVILSVILVKPNGIQGVIVSLLIAYVAQTLLQFVRIVSELSKKKGKI